MENVSKKDYYEVNIVPNQCTRLPKEGNKAAACTEGSLGHLHKRRY
jgi:hypothetical protein